MLREINKELSYFRLAINKANTETTLTSLEEQHETLDECLLPIPFSTHVHELTLAINNQGVYRGFSSELDLMIQKDESLRGHDYLKFWMRTYLVLNLGANFIIADAATYEQLGKNLSYEEKQTLLRMMRGMKYNLRNKQS